MCVRPIDITVNTRHGHRKVVSAPCGTCVECLKHKQNAWKLRLVHESREFPYMYFFTLTYRDDKLPCNVVYIDTMDSVLYSGTFPQCVNYCERFDLTHCDQAITPQHKLDYYAIADADVNIVSTSRYKDVSDYIKRIRMQFLRKEGRKLNMKYFIAAEHGPSPEGTRRPHYHGIIFSTEPFNLLYPLFNTWSSDYGRMEFEEIPLITENAGQVGSRSSKVANYVSKYCSKGEYESRLADIEHGHIERPRHRCSNGLGRAWLEQHRNDYLSFVPLCLEFENEYPELIWDDFNFEYFVKYGIILQRVGDRYYAIDSTVLIGDKINPECIDTDRAKPYLAEVERLVDNLKVYDGAFGYKIPRYYFERLFLRKITTEGIRANDIPYLRICPFQLLNYQFYGDKFSHSIIKNTFHNNYTMETSKYRSTRYVAETFLSAAIAYCLRSRALARYQRDAEALRKSNPALSDIEIHTQLNKRAERAKQYRKEDAEKKLLSFYETNRWKNPEFDEVDR